MPPGIAIAEFERSDQRAVRALLEASMRERWSRFDPAANPDLDDLEASFRTGVMLVARLDAAIVGCGGLVDEASGVCRVLRMSVAREHRNRGVGTMLLERLIAHAKARGCRRVVLETTSSWTDAVSFYERRGFSLLREEHGNRHFERRL